MYDVWCKRRVWCCKTSFLFNPLRTLRTGIGEGSLSFVLLCFSLVTDRILLKSLAITAKQLLFSIISCPSSALQLAHNVNFFSYSRQRKLFKGR